MTELTDRTGASVTVALDFADPVSAYTVSIGDGPPIGRAEFLGSSSGGERILFHTEVDPEFTGRGLAGLLIREALADSIRDGVTIVPVCSLFDRHLAKHGEDFRAAGGADRTPTPEDIAMVEQALR